MNTARDYLQEDMNKQPEQLQREADDVRADFEHTVDELVDQFSPGELINQVVSRFRNSGDSAFVNNLSNQIRNNPLPALLAGVSLAWLMCSSKQPPARSRRSSGPGASQRVGAAKEKVGTAKEKMSTATSRARATTHDATAGVKERGQRVAAGASDLRHRVSDSSHRTVDKARSGVQAARDNYNHMLEEQPLVVGALAIAAGAALGALLPRTSTEDRMFGDLSEEQKQELKHKAEDMKEQAESTVESKLEEQRSASGSSSQSGPESQRRDSASPSSHTQGQTAPASPNSPAAGASGPGSMGAETSGTGRGVETGTPPREATRAPEHPGTNPPDNNRSGINR